MNVNVDDAYLARKAREVYEHVAADLEAMADFSAADSFESDNVGADLAYLMGAILCSRECEWSRSRPILKILEEKYAEDAWVWKYVCILDDDEEEGS